MQCHDNPWKRRCVIPEQRRPDSPERGCLVYLEEPDCNKPGMLCDNQEMDMTESGSSWRLKWRLYDREKKKMPIRRELSNNPKLNAFLKRLLLVTYFEGESENLLILEEYYINLLVFEYFSRKDILKVSLMVKNEVRCTLELDEMEEIFMTFKALSEKKIPSWIPEVLKSFRMKLHSNDCVCKLIFPDNVETRVILLQLSTSEENEEETEILNSRGPTSYLNQPNEEPLILKNWIFLSSPKKLEEILHPTKKRVPLEEIMDTDDLLAATFIPFMNYRPVANEAFLLHHVTHGKSISLVFSVFIENGKQTVYLMVEDSSFKKNLHIFENIKELKLFSNKMSEHSHHTHLNDCIFKQLKEVLKESTHLLVQYINLSVRNIKTLDVMELDVNKDVKHELLEVRLHPKDTAVITKVGDLKITYLSFTRLLPNGWLDDLAIDGYLYLIKKKSEEEPNGPSICILSTYFLKSLMEGKVSIRIDRFEEMINCDIALIPYNPGKHWVLCCVDNRRRTILLYDSLYSSGYERILLRLQGFVMDLLHRFKDSELYEDSLPYHIGYGISVKQTNYNDCGIFFLTQAELLAQDMPFTFKPKHIPLIRARIIKNLLRGEVLPYSVGENLPGDTIGDFPISMSSIRAIELGEPLCATVIDTYLLLIARRSVIMSGVLPSVYVLDTKFSFCLMSDTREGLEKYKVDIFKYDMVFIPFTCDKKWKLYCVDNKNKTLLCYDSNPTTDDYPFEANIKSYLDLLPGWNNSTNPSELYHTGIGNAVKVNTFIDSGVFLLMHAEYLSRYEEFNFSLEEMKNIRINIMYELYVQKLLPPLPEICPPEFLKRKFPAEIPTDIPCSDHKFKTLRFGFMLEEPVVEAYIDLLTRHFPVWVHTEGSELNKTPLLFPFRNGKGWAVLALDKKNKIIFYFNIPSEGSIFNESDLIKGVINSDNISDFRLQKLPFPEHFVDSGVYMLTICFCLATGIPMHFNERHVSYLRKKIYWDLTEATFEHQEKTTFEHQEKTMFEHQEKTMFEHQEETTFEHQVETEIVHMVEIKIEHQEETEFEHQEETKVDLVNK